MIEFVFALLAGLITGVVVVASLYLHRDTRRRLLAGRGVTLITRERQRQQTEEGWSAEHDDQHRHAELAVNAALLAVDGTDYRVEPAPECCWGLVERHGFNAPHGYHHERAARIRALVIAGALIAADIDREFRAAHREAIVGQFDV